MSAEHSDTDSSCEWTVIDEVVHTDSQVTSVTNDIKTLSQDAPLKVDKLNVDCNSASSKENVTKLNDGVLDGDSKTRDVSIEDSVNVKDKVGRRNIDVGEASDIDVIDTDTEDSQESVDRKQDDGSVEDLSNHTSSFTDELPADFILNERVVKCYRHKRNNKLNVALTALMMVTIMSAMTLVAVHFLGKSNQQLEERISRECSQTFKDCPACPDSKNTDGSLDQDLIKAELKGLAEESKSIKSLLLSAANKHANNKDRLEQNINEFIKHQSVYIQDIKHSLEHRTNDVHRKDSESSKLQELLEQLIVESKVTRRSLELMNGENCNKRQSNVINMLRHENGELKRAVARLRYTKDAVNADELIKNRNVETEQAVMGDDGTEYNQEKRIFVESNSDVKHSKYETEANQKLSNVEQVIMALKEEIRELKVRINKEEKLSLDLKKHLMELSSERRDPGPVKQIKRYLENTTGVVDKIVQNLMSYADDDRHIVNLTVDAYVKIKKNMEKISELWNFTESGELSRAAGDVFDKLNSVLVNAVNTVRDAGNKFYEDNEKPVYKTIKSMKKKMKGALNDLETKWHQIKTSWKKSNKRIKRKTKNKLAKETADDSSWVAERYKSRENKRGEDWFLNRGDDRDVLRHVTQPEVVRKNWIERRAKLRSKRHTWSDNRKQSDRIGNDDDKCKHGECGSYFDTEFPSELWDW